MKQSPHPADDRGRAQGNKGTGQPSGPGRDARSSLRSRLTPEDARARAKVMKALGHPARLQMLDLLDQGDRCLCELHPLFSLRQPTLSRHLAVLKQAGIVTERRVGPRVVLHLATPCILRSFDCAMEVVHSEHARRSRALKPAPP